MPANPPPPEREFIQAIRDGEDSRDVFREYLDWLQNEWVPGRGMTPPDKRRRRPTLTLIRGGRDDG